MSSKIILRSWQKASYRLWAETRETKRYFVNVACPGAGKTYDALAKFALDREKYFDKLIVVSPTQKVRKQWQQEAKLFGLQVAILERNLRLDMFDGFSMTYQQLSGFLPTIRQYCLARRVMVVLDEPHHLADERTWGDKAQEAFVGATRILLATGTPFRSDNAKIPFLTYNQAGEGMADFIYGYAEAIMDGYCRVVQFHALDGLIRWKYSRNGNEEIQQAYFLEELPFIQESRRLRAALSPNTDFMQDMLQQAINKLNDLRLTQPDAGGLVVCMDIKHAKAIANLLLRLTGRQPVLVHSDDDRSIQKIDEFARSKEAWIVSIGMISEGVDIKRLRVLVFATNVKTAMAFRQIIGRIVRRRPNETGEKAFCYLPADPRLLKHVREIEEEINHVLKPKNGRTFEEMDFDKFMKELEPDDEIVFEALDGKAVKTHIFENGLLIRDGYEVADNGNLQEFIKNLRKLIEKNVAMIARLRNTTPAAINREWVRISGKRVRDMTVEDLKKKLAWTNGMKALYLSRQVYKRGQTISLF